MSRTKLILAGLLALLVVGVVATASTSTPASASGSCMKVGTPAYCVEGTPLVSTSENVEGTSGSAILKATIGGMTSEIKCATGKSAGTIEGGVAGAVGKSKIKITFETCKLIAPEHCKLTSADEEKIKTTELMGELEVSGGKVLDKLEPKGSAAFAGISIEGQSSLCAIAEVGQPETYSVTGSQLCEVDSSKTTAETEAEKHKLICKASGSGNLAIGGNPAEIADETMTVELSGAKAHDHWSVKET